MAVNKVECHIVHHKLPLCQCRLTLTVDGKSVLCGHESLASARRAMKAIQKLDWGYKIVRGVCPASLVDGWQK